MSSGRAPCVEELLAATPYLIADGPDNAVRFTRIADKARATRTRAVSAATAIVEQARDALTSLEVAVRSDLVAESNRMEGIDSSSKGVRDLVRVKRELLDVEVSSFVQYVRDDPRLLEALGLYRAYAVADEWAKTDQRPREFELRALHGLVMATHKGAGTYKSAQNEIGGSCHEPLPPWDVSRAMSELAAWFEGGTGDPVLDAAVVHAWLTHVHPFDDGNGRMARLLANLALIQSGYPPLLLRSGADRGQYLDALAASDHGDILPLYDLFVKSLRRVIRVMERPDYVQSKIRDELLPSVEQRRAAWRGLADTFFTCLEHKARMAGWSVQLMGYPGVEDFALLEQQVPEGKTWFAKLRDRSRQDRWLLWVGYQSASLQDLSGGRLRKRAWPSIFLSERSDDPRSVHPWSYRFEGDERRPAELSLAPGTAKPVTMRWALHTRDFRIDEAAGLLVKSICSK